MFDWQFFSWIGWIFCEFYLKLNLLAKGLLFTENSHIKSYPNNISTYSHHNASSLGNPEPGGWDSAGQLRVCLHVLYELSWLGKIWKGTGHLQDIQIGHHTSCPVLYKLPRVLQGFWTLNFCDYYNHNVISILYKGCYPKRSQLKRPPPQKATTQKATTSKGHHLKRPQPQKATAPKGHQHSEMPQKATTSKGHHLKRPPPQKATTSKGHQHSEMPQKATTSKGHSLKRPQPQKATNIVKCPKRSQPQKASKVQHF